MNIIIFSDLTTEDALLSIEKASKDYDGLYVDMYKDKERKFVKDKASLINDLLKKLERARIDKTKEFKQSVEKEASSLKERLENANKPFSLLIDAHKKERAETLAKEKAIQDAKDLAIQVEVDHGDAITLDKMRTFEIKEEIQAQKDRHEAIAKEASAKAEQEKELAEERAEQAEQDKILAEAKAKRDAVIAEEQAKQAKIDADIRAEKMAEQAKQAEIQRQKNEIIAQQEQQAKLEANKKHVGAVRCEIKEHLMEVCKIDEKTAKSIVLALLKTKRITINY